MSNDAIPDTFVLHIKLTPTIVLDLIESKDESLAFADSLDMEIKNTFGTGCSYELICKTHKLAKAETAYVDHAQYLNVSFEGR
jgi:hypothetical protein